MDASSTTAEAKKAFRARLQREIVALTPQECLESDRALFDRFLSLPQVEKADTLFLFWGIPGREPETEYLVRELTRQGKRVGLPRMLPGHQMEVRQFDPRIPMKQAAFGIWEPSEEALLLSKADIDLALVPAVCYDRRGYRLGFGGGYYDRWLEAFAGRTVGLCRGSLLQEQVPIEEHDARVDVVLTEQETRWTQA